MYSHVITLKQMFAVFFPKFKANVVRDDDAWRMVDTSRMLWTDEAINLKREGKYVESCRLYFDQIIARKAITEKWASGLFKTLAAAGDLADAVEFGFEWYNNYADQSQINSDKLVMHLGNLLALIQENPNVTMSFPDYLKAISGNPNYSIDMRQTDLYTDETLRNLRNNA